MQRARPTAPTKVTIRRDNLIYTPGIEVRHIPPPSTGRIGRDKPPEADGKRFGDRETDLTVDKHPSAILTLVERSANSLLEKNIKYGICHLIFPSYDL